MPPTFLTLGPQPPGFNTLFLTAVASQEGGVKSSGESLACLPPEREGRKAEWSKGCKSRSLTKVNAGSVGKRCRTEDVHLLTLWETHQRQNGRVHG